MKGRRGRATTRLISSVALYKKKKNLAQSHKARESLDVWIV
jgi:hypothetical protein